MFRSAFRQFHNIFTKPKQPKPSSIDPRAYAQMGFVGFGAVGQSVLAMQVAEIENIITQNPDDIPPLVEFNVYNEGDDFGHGQAYDVHTMLFTLNFPVQCAADRVNTPANTNIKGLKVGMHLIHDEVDDCADWLKERKKGFSPEERDTIAAQYKALEDQGWEVEQIAHRAPEIYRAFMLSRRDGKEWGNHSYLPRAMYREYLHSIFNRTQGRIAAINKKAGFEVIKLNGPIDCTVTNAEGTAPERLITATCKETANPENIVSKALNTIVFAMGFKRNQLFTEEAVNCRAFADTAFSDDEIEDALAHIDLKDEDSNVLIVGTGASYLDAVRNLYAIGYKGNITAISSNPTVFYPFDPRKNNQHYDLGGFLYGITDLTLEQIKERFVQELNSPYAIERGPQNLFKAIQDKPEIFSMLTESDYRALIDFTQTLINNRTSPQIYSTYEKVRDSGKLSFIASRMDTPKFDEVSSTWTTTLQNGDTVTSDMIVDCAGLSKKVVEKNGYISDPILRNAVDNGLASIDLENSTITWAPEYAEQICLVGAAATVKRGLPFTRHLFYEVARPMLEKALQISAQNQKELGIELAL